MEPNAPLAFGGAVTTYCNGANVLGHTTLFWNLGLGGSYLSLEFDDEAPNSPAFRPPFAGTFAPGVRIKKGIFSYLGVEEDGRELAGLNHSAFVTCFTALPSASSDALLSSCGNPPPAIPRPSVRRAYAFSGTDDGQVNGAKIYGKFVLKEAAIVSPRVCERAGLGVEQRETWSSVSGIDSEATRVTVVLPDGRSGTAFVILQDGSGVGVVGRCRINSDGSSTPIGPTRFFVFGDGGRQFLDITFDDAPPAQAAVIPPFAAVLPQTTRFSTATFSFAAQFGSLPFTTVFGVKGNVACLAPMAWPDDDPAKSACGDGSNVAGARPTILSSQGVVNGASFGEGIASGAWLSIRGSDLARTTRTWTASDFNGAALPTSLDGVQVRINGRSAYVYYVSPTQLNVLAPDDPAIGPVSVQVTSANGVSAAVTVTKAAFSPALFAYSTQSGRYAVAQNATTFALIGPPGLLGPGATTRPARPGEPITLYATGLGPVTPSRPIGEIVPAPTALASPVQVTIGGAVATVVYAGLVSSGLYQINAVVPNIGSGDAALVIRIGDVVARAATFVPIQ